MTERIEQLIEALRDELKEYGEMLALLDEQQGHLMSRRADGVLESVSRINDQALVLKRTRTRREETQHLLACAVGHAECTGLFVLAQYLPADYRPLLQALVNENNQLLGRVQKRGRQNHLLLSRSVELMQQFISTLNPGKGATMYGGDGAVHTNSPSNALYEALG
ncbi:MAG TPA: flagellar protein FlgN [Candidatus Limnocylindria bacterium]|nr:flagellar protein FlgN [Candidatus Limnocylindria bacterium]